MNTRARMPGAGLVECVVALALGTIVAAVAAACLNNGIRLGTVAALRGERLDAVRTVAAALRSDLTPIAPGDAVLASDSIRLRVFRGTGIVCDTSGGELRVRLRGPRLPEPDKDSVLVLAAAGAATFHLASGTAATGCAASTGERVFRFDLEPVPNPIAPGTPLLLFETGTYVLADRALRYRRGAGGRQPLTAEVFTTGSRFEIGPRRVRVRLETGPAGPEQATVRWLSVPLPNAPGS